MQNLFFRRQRQGGGFDASVDACCRGGIYFWLKRKVLNILITMGLLLVNPC